MSIASKTKLSWGLFVFACIVLILAGGWRALVKNRSQDFAPVYAGSKCLLSHCNPYDTKQLEQQLFGSGAKKEDVGTWYAEMPVYPPSTFAVVLPLTFVSYPQARLIWFLFSVLSFCAGAFATVGLCNPSTRTLGVALVSIIMIGSTGAFGNPGVPAIGLAVCAVWLAFRTNRWVWVVLLLGVSIALKPQVTGPLLIWLFLHNAKYRRMAWLSAAVSIVLLVVPIAVLTAFPASAGWLSQLRANLSIASGPGGINDPTVANPDAMRMTNLQTAFAVIYPDPGFYNGATWVIAGICFAIWLRRVLTRCSAEETRLFEIASLVCLTCLPVYHRLQDARMLLLAVPALAWLLAKHRPAGIVAMALTAPALFSLTFQAQAFLEGNRVSSLNAVIRLLLTRQAPLALLALTLIYLWARRRFEPAEISPPMPAIQLQK